MIRMCYHDSGAGGSAPGKEEPKVNENGSITVETGIAASLFILFFSILLLLNFRVFSAVENSCGDAGEAVSVYAEVHRAASVIFETGGDLYELFFG